MTSRTVPDRVSDWYQAFQAVREELTPPSQRSLNVVQEVGRWQSANDRTAAIVAAMLVTTGIRPVQVEQEDGG